MKKLQEQIDLLNAQQKPVESNTGKIMSLFAVTSLLSYGHKLPLVSKLIKLLSVWYGRTNWWKLLVNLRKAFVILNALIGVYATYKLTGFSPNNIIPKKLGIRNNSN